MSPNVRVRNEHPTYQSLALYSRKDLPWSTRWGIRNHVRKCVTCLECVESLQSSTAELRREAELQTLTGYEAIADWSRLEREMIGNIAVGVAAARCIDHVGHTRTGLVRVGFGIALTALFVAGWATHVPSEESKHLWASVKHWAGGRSPDSYGMILQSSPDGVAVRSSGSSLMMMHPRSAVISVSNNSQMEARYIDSETGQVTIASVYGQ